MKRLAFLALAALATCGGIVRAQQLDLAARTCKDFEAKDKETVLLMLMWLEAYYTEPDAKPLVDFDRMKADGARMGDYCSKNPGHNVITTADSVLRK